MTHNWTEELLDRLANADRGEIKQISEEYGISIQTLYAKRVYLKKLGRKTSALFWTPGEVRFILYLRKEKKLKWREIGDILGKSEHAVRTIARRRPIGEEIGSND